MGDVFVLAVVAALDAGLIAAAVVLLGRPRPAHKLFAYLIGGMGFSIGFGILIVLILHGADFIRHPDSAASAVIEVAAGALLIVVAAVALSGRTFQWQPRRRRGEEKAPPKKPSLKERAVGHDSLWVAWAAGALYSFPGAYYLAGLALLIKLDRPWATDVLAIVIFNIVMFAFIELPLLGFLLAPDRTRDLVERFDGWLHRHKRKIIVVIAGAGGIYLLVSGISGLA